MDLVAYFNLMERNILGTGCIDNIKRGSGNYPTGKNSHKTRECKNCDTFFLNNQPHCPFCHTSETYEIE